MLPFTLGAMILGATLYHNPGTGEFQEESYEDIDDLMYGRLREENYTEGNNWTSEQSRIIRPTIGKADPVVSAKRWTQYHRKLNQALQGLYAKHKIADNQRILRPTIESKQRILSLPDSTFTLAQFVPNAYVDYVTPPVSGAKRRLDNDYSIFDDKASQAGGINVQYISIDPTYFGTPWGPGGQLFQQMRAKEPENTADVPRTDKRVRFGGTTVF